MAYAIQTNNLGKKYANAYGVREINLEIEEGVVYGFIGPNGAGKTTTISLLTGLIAPTEGEVCLMGKPLTKEALTLKKRIGVVPDNPYLYGYMSAKEYLGFFSDLYGVSGNNKRIDELLSYFNLSEHGNKKLKKYSHGMKQKVNIARALVHDPDILFLDEAISGLDPSGMKEVRDIILSEKKKGKTIFISSHILSEMDRICDVVGIIIKGRMVMSGKIDRVISSIKAGGRLVVEVEKGNAALSAGLKEVPGVTDVSSDGNTYRILSAKDWDIRGAVSRTLTKNGAVILGMKEDKAGLEEAFVELVKEK
ncbi:MAG: ABC transporter ATP-binding protein [Candidatus Altiarchaeia archaeon]